MDLRDYETEQYLKEFHPRKVRAFEGMPHGPRWFASVLGAAALLIVVAALAWFHMHSASYLKPRNEPILSSIDRSGNHGYRSTASLTSLALTDDKEFERVLAEKSQESLPSFGAPKSMLKVLAKD